jgi:hypothetical protein
MSLNEIEKIIKNQIKNDIEKYIADYAESVVGEIKTKLKEEINASAMRIISNIKMRVETSPASLEQVFLIKL